MILILCNGMQMNIVITKHGSEYGNIDQLDVTKLREGRKFCLVFLYLHAFVAGH